MEENKIEDSPFSTVMWLEVWWKTEHRDPGPMKEMVWVGKSQAENFKILELAAVGTQKTYCTR